MSDSELLQKLRDLILRGHLKQVKVFILLLIFVRLLLLRFLDVFQIKCKVVSLDLALLLDDRVVRVGEESDFGALMISQLHVVALMVLLAVFLCLSFE